MGSTYRNRKHVARFVLVPFVFILLFALNVRLYDGTYNQHNLDKFIVNQTKELTYCILSNIDNRENITETIPIKQLLDTAIISIIINCAVLSFIRFILVYKSKRFCQISYTLVSLCVRMDE